jgi:hypothetical protein
MDLMQIEDEEKAKISKNYLKELFHRTKQSESPNNRRGALGVDVDDKAR